MFHFEWKLNDCSADLHFNSDGVQSSEVERRIPQQNVERTSSRVALPQRFPIHADMHRCDRSLGEGQDPSEKQKNFLIRTLKIRQILCYCTYLL